MKMAKRRLYDAAENFNRALEQARLSQGEPVSGIERKIWEAQRWGKEQLRNRSAWFGAATIFGSTFAGAVVLLMRSKRDPAAVGKWAPNKKKQAA
jgi:hypothetical protein